MDAILSQAIDQGLGYALFVILLFYVLKKQDERDKKSEERENKYQQIITGLTQDLSIKVDKVIEKVEEIWRK